MPKSLRLISASASKPTVSFLLNGFSPAPMNSASSVTDLVMPFSVRLPVISASMPFTFTLVDTKRASAGAGPKKSALAPSLPARSRCSVRPLLAVTTLETGMVTSTFAAPGFLGSSTSVPFTSPNRP